MLDQLEHTPAPLSEGVAHKRAVQRWKKAAKVVNITHRWAKSNSVVDMTRKMAIRAWQELIYSGHSKAVVAVLIHKNVLFTASHDSTCRSWDMNTHGCVGKFERHTQEIRAMIIAQATSGPFYLVSGSSDTTICAWRDCNPNTEPVVMRGHSAGVKSLCHASDWILSASHDQTARQWELSSGNCIREFRGHVSPLTNITFVGDRLVSCAGDCKVRVWKLEPCTQVTASQILTGHNAVVEVMVVIPDKLNTEQAASLVSGDVRGRILRWNLQTCITVHEYEGHTSSITAILVTSMLLAEYTVPILIASAADGKIRVWTLDTIELIKTIERHYLGVLALHLLEPRNGSDPVLFSCGADCVTVAHRLCAESDFSQIGRYTGHKQAVRDMAIFEPPSGSEHEFDGPILFTCSDDASIRSFKVYDWSSGMVMNAANGTWPNNLLGFAKLMFDTVQLLSFPFEIVDKMKDMRSSQNINGYRKLFSTNQDLISGLQFFTDPLQIIQVFFKYVQTFVSQYPLPILLAGNATTASARGSNGFLAALAVVAIQLFFLFLNTRTAILWKFRQHVLQPGAGSKFFVTRYLPRIVASLFLNVVMWVCSTVLFMPVAEALFEELQQKSDIWSPGFWGVVALIGVYLVPASRLTCLQDRIEFMDVSAIFRGKDSLEDAMQDSHLFSIKSIFYQRAFFILQTLYIIVGVERKDYEPRALSLLVCICGSMLALTCWCPPYYHERVNYVFVFILGHVLWANVACWYAVTETKPQFKAEQFVTTQFAGIGFPTASCILFYIIRALTAKRSAEEVQRVTIHHSDTTYIPALSVLRVPDLEAISASIRPLLDRTRDKLEREKLVRQGAIKSIVVAFKYTSTLRLASRELLDASKRPTTWLQDLSRLFTQVRIRIYYGLRLQDADEVQDTARNLMRTLGNLLVETFTPQQAISAGVPILLLGDIWAASEAVTARHLQEFASASSISFSIRPPLVLQHVPFDKQLAEFAMNTVMNMANNSDVARTRLMEMGIIPIILPLLRFAAFQSERYLIMCRNSSVGSTHELLDQMPVTSYTIDLASRVVAVLALTNKEDEQIKSKIIDTGVVDFLLQLARAPFNSPPPFSNWSSRAIKALSNLCDYTDNSVMKEQLSTRMVQLGVMEVLFLHIKSTDKDFQLRALEGLSTLCDTQSLRSVLDDQIRLSSSEIVHVFDRSNVDKLNEILTKMYGSTNSNSNTPVPELWDLVRSSARTPIQRRFTLPNPVLDGNPTPSHLFGRTSVLLEPQRPEPFQRSPSIFERISAWSNFRQSPQVPTSTTHQVDTDSSSHQTTATHPRTLLLRRMSMDSEASMPDLSESILHPVRSDSLNIPMPAITANAGIEFTVHGSQVPEATVSGHNQQTNVCTSSSNMHLIRPNINVPDSFHGNCSGNETKESANIHEREDNIATAIVVLGSEIIPPAETLTQPIDTSTSIICAAVATQSDTQVPGTAPTAGDETSNVTVPSKRKQPTQRRQDNKRTRNNKGDSGVSSRASLQSEASAGNIPNIKKRLRSSTK